MQPWTTQDAKDLYNIGGWSSGFFGINSDGHVILTKKGTGTDGEVDLKQVVDDLVRRGLSMQLLIRFSDLLDKRLAHIAGAFNAKI